MTAFPPADGDWERAAEQLRDCPDRISLCRKSLGSLSDYMKHLKQPIAVRINKEDQVRGHLFEQRFYSGALLDDNAVLAAMRYVDLNPFRARITKTLEGSEDYCWTPAGHLLMAKGSELYRIRPGQDQEWQLMADLGVGEFYRLAMSPNGNKLAVVVFQGDKP